MQSMGLQRVRHKWVTEHNNKAMFGTSLVAQMVKNLPAMQETQIRSLDWEDTLEKRMDTHSSILAWEIPWTRGLGAIVHEITESWTELGA